MLIFALTLGFVSLRAFILREFKVLVWLLDYIKNSFTVWKVSFELIEIQFMLWANKQIGYIT